MYVRKIDSLGRIVIPKKFRELLDININDELVIEQSQNKLIIRKRTKRPECLVTKKQTEDVKDYGNGIFLSDEGVDKILRIINGRH